MNKCLTVHEMICEKTSLKFFIIHTKFSKIKSLIVKTGSAIKSRYQNCKQVRIFFKESDGLHKITLWAAGWKSLA